MATTPRYDPTDTRTLPLHPEIGGQPVRAVLPDGHDLEPGRDGLFLSELPVLTKIYVDAVGWWKIAPDGQLGPPWGHPTPYPSAAQAHVVSIRLEGDDAFLVVDTVPSRPLRTVCGRRDGLWVYDVERCEYAEA
jgi:hypothetical protein